ncbi:MAG TPA: Smr/MutS family protein [Azospirillaceae bacterium]|nr:Smr/MutS family protein [Azospirillaceae bacterium]
MARGRRPPTEEEVRLWREVMRDAAPLARARRKGALKPEPPPAPPPAPAPVLAAPPPPSYPPPLPKPVRPAPLPPLIPGERAGLDRRTDERLRRGKLEIDGRIDLHGMTQSEAHDALLAFVARAHREGRRNLLVITGKGAPTYGGADAHRDRWGEGGLTAGRGVLRSAVPRWLAEAPMRPLVLAIRQAQQHHGGGGAFYVLLKRKRAS